jgi:hypothetical protein
MFMKYLKLGFIICFLAFQNCQKNNVSNSADLTGTWNWIFTHTDGAPGPLNPLTPLNSGITQSLTFANGKWRLDQNNTEVSSGSFKISHAISRSGKNIQSIHYFHTANPADSLTYYEIRHDTLVFSYDLSGSVGSIATFYSKQ